MIFESKYRRQAMQLWEQTKEESKQELLEDLRKRSVRLQHALHKVKEAGAWLLRNKRTNP